MENIHRKLILVDTIIVVLIYIWLIDLITNMSL